MSDDSYHSASDPKSESESEESDLSDSDLEGYEKKSYLRLRAAPVGSQIRVVNPDNTYRCPYCPGKKKQSYTYKDLLAHATGVGASTTSWKRKPREVADHRALARYLKSDIGNGSSGGTSVAVSTSNGKVATSVSSGASTSNAQRIVQNEVATLLFLHHFFFFFAKSKRLGGKSANNKPELSLSGKVRIVQNKMLEPDCIN